jgi:hypothetical protein
MSTQQKHSKQPRRRSRAIPLSLVPVLAGAITASGCSKTPDPIDPCEPASYIQATCDSAVANRGYWYGGTWHSHVYPLAAGYYLGRHASFVAGGGRVQRASPAVYTPSTSGTRAGVVRGGFGGIGAGHISAGS